MKLHFADNLSLPADAVTQTFVFFGKRGSGTSNGRAHNYGGPMVPGPGLYSRCRCAPLQADLGPRRPSGHLRLVLPSYQLVALVGYPPVLAGPLLRAGLCRFTRQDTAFGPFWPFLSLLVR